MAGALVDAVTYENIYASITASLVLTLLLLEANKEYWEGGQAFVEKLSGLKMLDWKSRGSIEGYQIIRIVCILCASYLNYLEI